MVGQTNPLRQQMINMMYLVLVALLAMNVSAEVLRAFQLVNEGLEETRSNFETKNAFVYQTFQAAYDNDSALVRDHYNNAMQARLIAQGMVDYIDDIKKWIVDESGLQSNGRLKKESDLNFGSVNFITQGKGSELKAKIEETRENLIELLPERDRGNVTLTLDASDPRGPTTWEQQMFLEVPLSAIYTLLTKLQNDARNSEGEIINHLFGNITADHHKFDMLQPIVSINKSAVLVNEEYEAKIFLGAYSSTQQPRIIVDGKELDVAGGHAVLRRRADRQGDIPIKGQIIVQNPDGSDTSYSFSTQIQAFTGSATISADAMNVLYVGLDNPISVSVPGFPPDLVTASITGGTLTRTGSGKYIAKVTAGGNRTARISVTARMDDGSSRNMGSQEYRIRQVPRPVAYFGNKTSGDVSRGEIGAVNFLTARLDNFVFDGINYRVTSYTYVHQPRTGTMNSIPGTGANFSPAIIQSMRSANPGDQIIFTNIRAASPGIGEIPLQGAIALTVR